MESALDIKGTAYKGFIDKCNEMFEKVVAPAFSKVGHCLNGQPLGSKSGTKYKRSTEDNQVIRTVREVLLLSGVVAVTALVGGGAAVYSYVSPNSSSNRLDRLDVENMNRDQRLKALEESLNRSENKMYEAHLQREEMVRKLEVVEVRTSVNRQAIGHLAQLVPEQAWAAASIHQLLTNDEKNFQAVERSCKKRLLNTQALYRLTGDIRLVEIDEQDTYIDQVEFRDIAVISMDFLIGLFFTIATRSDFDETSVVDLIGHEKYEYGTPEVRKLPVT